MPSPQRSCVGCRRTGDQRDLLRLTADPAIGAAVLDERNRLGGRGAYLHPDPACITAALRRRSVPRALRLPGCDTTLLVALTVAYAKSPDHA